MTGRARILAAIDHRQPDRVPVDLGATPSSGISAVAYGKLKQHLGVTAGQTRIYDVVQQLAQPEEAILDRYGIDVVDLGRTFNTADCDWYDITLWDGQAAQYPAWFHPEPAEDGGYLARAADGTRIARQPRGGAFFDQICYPYLDGYPSDYSELPDAMSKILWAALVHSPWDHAGDEGFWQTLRQRALELRASTDRAIMIVCGCNLFEWGTFLRRLDQFVMDIVLEPVEVERLLDELMAVHLHTLELVCEAVGEVVDILRFGDDLGFDQGPFMTPESYRKLFKPRHTQLCEYVHQHSSMRTLLHSCGSIRELIPDLIDAGFEVLNPVQTNCRGMDPAELKREFGRDVTFWGGGCDTRHVLNCGTPADVRRDVLTRLRLLAPGGGYVFNTIHNILPEVPPENIVAMYDAVAEFNGES